MADGYDDGRDYWAACPDSERFVEHFKERQEQYLNALGAAGITRRAARAWRTFYGWAPSGWGDTSQTGSAGEQGEWLQVTTNDFAALVQQSLTMTTSERPAFKVVGSNDDFKSRAQCVLGEGLLDYYDKQFGIYDREVEAVLIALLASQAWVIDSWNASAGQLIAADDEGTVREGDIESVAVSPFDVALDAKCANLDRLRWIAFRTSYPRHDLIATFPHLRDELLADSDDTSDSTRRATFRGRDESTDSVFVWEFRHLPTPALPKGRLARFINSKCVLYDSLKMTPEGLADFGYPYEKLHAESISPEPIPGGVLGHSNHFDLLSLQEGIDTGMTQAATASNAGGVTNIWVGPEGSYAPSTLVGGLNLLKGTTKPELVDGVKLDPQVMNFVSMCVDLMRRRVGLNDAAMGETQKGMPAQLAALMEAKAMQFQSRLQAGYQRLVERTRTGKLKLLKTFAATTRVALIAGKAKTWALKEWSRDDIEGIDRVVVEAVSAQSKTYASRLAMADKLLDQGLISKDEYVSLLDTGRLTPMYEFESANLARINKWKELLQTGVGLPPVDPIASEQAGSVVFVSDGQPHINPTMLCTPWLDVRELATIALSPDAAEQPGLVENVTNLIMREIELWQQMPVVLQQVLGCPAELIQMPPMVPGQSGTMPPAPGEESSTGAPAMPVESPPGGPSVPDVRLPKPPPNPITGAESAPMEA